MLVFYSTNKNLFFPLLRQYLLEFPYSTFSFSAFLPFQVVQFKNNHFRLLFHEHFSPFPLLCSANEIEEKRVMLVGLQNKHF